MLPKIQLLSYFLNAILSTLAKCLYGQDMATIIPGITCTLENSYRRGGTDIFFFFLFLSKKANLSSRDRLLYVLWTRLNYISKSEMFLAQGIKVSQLYLWERDLPSLKRYRAYLSPDKSRLFWQKKKKKCGGMDY